MKKVHILIKKGQAMKKIFLLSFLLIPIATQCMLKQSSSKRQLISWQSSSKNNCIKRYKTTARNSIKQDIENFNKQLARAQDWRCVGPNDPLFFLVTCKYPKSTYGYTETKHAPVFNKLSVYHSDPKQLMFSQSIIKAQYNGYSAIGAALLAKEEYDIKKKTIRNLLNAGVVPTEKDNKLARYLKISDILSNVLNRE